MTDMLAAASAWQVDDEEDELVDSSLKQGDRGAISGIMVLSACCCCCWLSKVGESK